MRRCAVYTRKSSEEGLEQEFNSLHAQREACEAFIKSQKGEGWKLVPTAYDDGGLSGGNMDRPGLKQLLQDIRDRRIDVVVVYKVDRLTRSLADFAKMMEVFDASEVSFVSVTQQFNTTSSMGRLTLNILLSFAQFERELTGERIRDKIAASKKKGIWMGGLVPLGYDAKDRKLLVNPAEADQVRLIYELYLDVGCVRKLRLALDRKGFRSKARAGAAGRVAGNCSFSRGALYALLRNPVYIGKIRHKGAIHPGQQEPIIAREIWDLVQARLDASNGGRTKGVETPQNLLAGRLFDEQGHPLVPNHAVKGGKRYRYYVSKPNTKEGEAHWRLPADQIEAVVRHAIVDCLNDGPAVAAQLTSTQPKSLAAQLAAIRRAAGELATGGGDLRSILERADLQPTGLKLSLTPFGGGDSTDPSPTLSRIVPMSIRRRGVETRLVLESGNRPAQIDETLIRAVARARAWLSDICSGAVQSHKQLAAREGVAEQYVNQLLPLAFLSPRTVEAIVTGHQPAQLTTKDLMTRVSLPHDWAGQHRLLGLS